METTAKIKRLITGFKKESILNYEVSFMDENSTERIIDIHRYHIADFIEQNISNYKEWFDTNWSGSLAHDSHEEMATEMAAQVYGEEWMFQDYIESLTDKEVAELEVKSALTLDMRLGMLKSEMVGQALDKMKSDEHSPEYAQGYKDAMLAAVRMAEIAISGKTAQVVNLKSELSHAS